MMETPKSLARKSLQGLEFVPIKELEDGRIQIYRKKLREDEVLLYVRILLENALKDIIELQYTQKDVTLEKNYTVDELIQVFKQDSSDFVLTACTNRDRIAKIISTLQCALALVKYVVGDEYFYNYFNN